MGIQGLTAVLNSAEAFEKGFIEITSLSKLVAEWRAKHRNCRCEKPVVVIDGANIGMQLMSPPLLYGGQWKQFRANAEKFVKIFKQLRLNVVVMFDGTFVEEFEDAWIRRKGQNARDLSAMCRKLQSSCYWSEEEIFNFQARPGGPGALCYIMKDLGVEAYRTVNSNDQEIAAYAYRQCQNCCLGVISSDSDFFVFETGCPWLMLDQSRVGQFMRNLEVLKVNQAAVLQSWELQAENLKIFAALAGTDAIPKEKLLSFHNDLRQDPMFKRLPVKPIFHRLARFVTMNAGNIDAIFRNSFGVTVLEAANTYRLDLEFAVAEFPSQISDAMKAKLLALHQHCVYGFAQLFRVLRVQCY